MEASLNTQLRHMRREFDDIYRRIIETVHERSKDDGYVLNQAVREAMQEFAANGITGFTDLAGRRWGLYEYTNMAMRTAIHRAGLQATIDVMHQQNIDLCYVTQHEGACPLCTPWYGRVMSLSGRSYGFPTVQDAMNAGLFHPNCMDVLQPYIPGVSDLNAGVPVGWTLEDTRRRYAASQRQRAYEREIRKWKRVQAAAGTPEEERIARAHIVELQRRLRALTAENSLPRQYDREGGKVLLSEEAKKIKPFALDANGRVVAAEGLKGGVLRHVTTSDGISVSVTRHLVERMKQREVTMTGAIDALTNPLDVGKIKVDEAGRPSKQYIGEKVTVAVNPDNGNIVSTWPTSSKRVQKLKEVHEKQ